MFDLFLAGGKLGMSILTAELICMLFAAWKAPAWVKEIGLLALVTGIFYQFLGMFQAFGVIQMAGDISPSLVAGAMRMMYISLIYALAIYAISLVIRMLQKPRI